MNLIIYTERCDQFMRYTGDWKLDKLTNKLLELAEIINDCIDEENLDGAGFFLADIPDLMEKINEVYEKETGKQIF